MRKTPTGREDYLGIAAGSSGFCIPARKLLTLPRFLVVSFWALVL